MEHWSMFSKRRGIQLAVALVLFPVVAWLTCLCPASGATLTAGEILDRLESTAVLSGSGSAKIELITENKRGQQRSNKLQVYRRKDADGTEKQLLEYLAPADVAGTKLLSITKPDEESQIWLFMPALGRERRIAGQETKSKFMGTDFTYEEISGSAAYSEDYSGERLPDDTFDGHKCFALRLTPKGKSDYAFVKMWVWQDEFLPTKIEFYNRESKLRKGLSTSGWRKGEKDSWEPSSIVMSDELAGTKSIIKLIETSQADIADDYFTLRYLRRR